MDWDRFWRWGTYGNLLVIGVLLSLLFLSGCAKDTYPPAIPEPPAVFQPDPWKDPAPPPAPPAPSKPTMSAEEQELWDRLVTPEPAPPPDPKAPTTAAGVVAQANKAAQIDPTMERYDGGKRARQIYPFVDGAIYKILVGTVSETTLALPRGERLAMEIEQLMNPDEWFSMVQPIGEGQAQHDIVKLLARLPGKKMTTSLVFESGKVLYLALESVEHTGMVAVAWEWPRMFTAKGVRPPEPSLRPAGMKAPTIALDRLHKYYVVEVVKGVSPYQITDVFDDGYLTVIRFAQPLTYTAVPTVFMRYADGSSGPVNARPYADPAHPEKGTFYILQGVFPAIELRGPDRVEIRIVRQVAPSTPILTTVAPF